MSSRNNTPGQEPPAESATAIADPPSDANGAGQSFASRVGSRKGAFAPDPFSIATDNIAGVQLFESKRDRQMAIKFDDKPSQGVIEKLKEASYRWNPTDRIWVHPVEADFAMSTRIEAEKLYQEVRSMVRQEKGFGAGQDMSR
jgi:hypothetical protein